MNFFWRRFTIRFWYVVILVEVLNSQPRKLDFSLIAMTDVRFLLTVTHFHLELERCLEVYLRTDR